MRTTTETIASLTEVHAKCKADNLDITAGIIRDAIDHLDRRQAGGKLDAIDDAIRAATEQYGAARVAGFLRLALAEIETETYWKDASK